MHRISPLKVCDGAINEEKGIKNSTFAVDNTCDFYQVSEEEAFYKIECSTIPYKLKEYDINSLQLSNFKDTYTSFDTAQGVGYCVGQKMIFKIAFCGFLNPQDFQFELNKKHLIVYGSMIETNKTIINKIFAWNWESSARSKGLEIKELKKKFNQ